MPVPRPAVATPPLQRLGPALAGIGLPGLAAVDPMAPPWAHASFRLRFAPETGSPDRMLRRVLHAPLRDSLAAELAALSTLQHRDRLPVVREYRILPPGLLGFRAALSSLLPGTQGMRLMKERPARAPGVAATVGRMIALLQAVPVPGFGTTPIGGRFAARRGTWREEWAAWVWGALGLARSDGVHLGPLTDAVEARLSDQLGALDTVTTFSLVHGDLHPSNLLFEPTEGDGVRLTGLVDWEGAFAGDPLAEWAVSLELPAETLGHVLEGYGRDAAAALLADPEAIARLEVYAWTRCLTRLAWCTGGLFRGDGGRRRAFALEYARQTHEAALQPGFVVDKLQAALDSGARGPVVAAIPSSAAQRSRSRALEATHRPTPTEPGAAVALSAALAATRLAEVAPAPLDAAWLTVAERATDLLGPQAGRQWAEPVPDRAAWAAGLSAELTTGPARVGFALAALWLGLDAVERVGAASDDALRGLETVVRLRQAADAAVSVVGDREALAHALLGCAACDGLAAAGLPVSSASHAAWRAWLRHAWDDVVLFGAGAGKPDEPVAGATWLARGPRLEGADLLAPTLRAALDAVEELPAPPEVVWATLGFAG